MTVQCVWEHNGSDTLLYAVNLPGAYTRGATRETAIDKMEQEARAYLKWRGEPAPDSITVAIVQDAPCSLEIRDADSDVLFAAEQGPMTADEYQMLKDLALKSAADFLSLYLSVPEKNTSCLSARETFYGQIPRTAEEMYQHTKNVNTYYFSEIGVDADNAGTILDCRRRGFAALETKADYLLNQVFDGSYGELWSLRKVLRRFLWHDRIHARAMYRMAVKTFGAGAISDVFSFESS